MSCPTGVLVNFSSETESTTDACQLSEAINKKPDSASSEKFTSDSQGDASVPAVSKESRKLCGYLTKISSTGPIKTSKTRWFSYNADSCELVYSRNPDPEVRNSTYLGKIPLRRASFNFTAANLQENMFSISADGIVHTLQACDQKTLLWWLQELQSSRRAFNLHQSEELPLKPDWQGSILGSSVFWVSNGQGMSPGLLDAHKSDSEPSSIVQSTYPHMRIFPADEEPPDTVGEKAATLQKGRSASTLSGSGIATLGRISVPSLDGINAKLASAGESAKKTLRTQAQRLRSPAMRQTDLISEEEVVCGRMTESNKAGNFARPNDKGFSSFTKGLKQDIVKLQAELELTKMEVQTKEESVQVLKMELLRYEQQYKGNVLRSTLSEDERKLRSEIIGLKLTNERLLQEKEESSAREANLTEQNAMLQEMLTIKDEVVVQLSNQLHDLEQSHKALNDDHVKLKEEKHEEFVVITPAEPEENITSLKDRAEGFMMQNKLLNYEILELANLRQMDERKLASLREKAQLKEAEFCQLNSKYLVLLAEMNKPRSGSVGLAVAGAKIDTSDQDRKDLVKILIQEALDDTADAAHAGWMRKDSKYDKYGFSCRPEDDAESSLLSAASHMEKKAADIVQSLDEFHASVVAKWQNYLAVNKELQRSEELKMLIRFGVPHEHRSQVWGWLVKRRSQQIRQRLDPDNQYYSQLGKRKEAPLASKQIELDLLRTLPNNRHFGSLSSGGIDQLRRVLRAYSIHNPTIGYCQGLNRIAAVALLYLCEEEAFWCLVSITEFIMPENYYSHTLTASQADQRVFRDLVAEKLPRLHRHLETAGVDTSLITFNWLLCIYCDNVPPETMLHIWDVFLNEGSKLLFAASEKYHLRMVNFSRKIMDCITCSPVSSSQAPALVWVLFRYGLAFFKSVEEEILQLKDYMSIFTFLRVMSHRMHDIRNLTQIAFQSMNPFPMRRINRLRAIHLEKVNAELRELDALRKGFVSFRRDVGADSDDD